MVTSQQNRIHKKFLNRQKVYENRYSRKVLAVLSKQYTQAAKDYFEGYPIYVNEDDYEPVYRRLYVTCMTGEASHSWDRYVKPLQAEQKDIIDALTELLSTGMGKGSLIRLWRQMALEYFQVSILTRIQEVAETTRKAIAKIIENGINEGMSMQQISTSIRKQAKGDINKNRSRVIARTETVNAMNKGQRLGVLSSGLLWDKKWLATEDDRTRLPHAHMNREGYFPLEQPYYVNGEYLDYPGDPSQSSAGNVINCRCSEVYRVRRGSDGRPLRKN